MSQRPNETSDSESPPGTPDDPGKQRQIANREEYGGPPGKEPTRYGDWEKNGRCIDF